MVFLTILVVLLVLVPVVLGFAYLKLSRPGPRSRRPSKVDLKNQSKETVTEGSGQTSVRVFNPKTKPVCSISPDLRSLYHLFSAAVAKYGTRRCLGTRSHESSGVRGKFQWKSYSEVNQRAINFSAGLVSLGAKQNDCIGIYSKNREEWVVTEVACYKQSLVIVSFYDTLGANAVEFIANHSQTKIVVCSAESFPKMAAAAPKCSELEHIIVMEGITDDLRKKAEAIADRVQLHSFNEVEEAGRKNKQTDVPPCDEDLSTIMYTSGTTGDPKGVMITHGNMLATLKGVIGIVPSVSEKDAYLSYLPLAHIFERAVVSLCLGVGARVGFYQGDVRKLTADLGELKPTVFAGVPRVFDRVYDAIQKGMASKPKLARMMFDFAFEVKREALKVGRTTPLWDMIMFSNLKKVMGGRIRFIITGSAPLSAKVHEFMRICLCCPVLQGYGLTETTAGATISDATDPSVGHCGPPILGAEIKLVDVPDMDYLSTDKPFPRGEIWIRGAQVSKGYFKNEEKTAEDYAEGWFHTGDIGQWNANGTLSIIDRKKNLFKLAQGEYIAPEKLENALERNPLVAQLWVYGDSNKASLVGICVPEKEEAMKWAAANGKASSSFPDLCQDDAFNKVILKVLEESATKAKLHRFEMVKRVHLHPEEFSPDNDLQTPTFKLRRPFLKKRFVKEIERLYDGLQ